MRLQAVGLLAGAAVIIAVGAVPNQALAQTVVSREFASHIVKVSEVKVENGVVSGVLVNRSDKLLRNMRLLIRHTWFWQHERRPGRNNPGRAVYLDVPTELDVGQQVSFTYTPQPPLPARKDGHFETSAEISAFTEVSFE